jgi:hypothetical protein
MISAGPKVEKYFNEMACEQFVTPVVLLSVAP